MPGVQVLFNIDRSIFNTPPFLIEITEFLTTFGVSKVKKHICEAENFIYSIRLFNSCTC